MAKRTNSDPVQAALDKLDDVKGGVGPPPQWEAICPVHGGTKRSLRITVGDDDGLPKFHCHRVAPVCTWNDIRAALIALGVPEQGLGVASSANPSSSPTPSTPRPKRAPAEPADPPIEEDLGVPLTKVQVARLTKIRGVSKAALKTAGVGWTTQWDKRPGKRPGKRFTLPVKDVLTGELVDVQGYDPDASPQWKMVHRTGGTARLYAPTSLDYPAFDKAEVVVVCEGEWDALVARERGFNAVGTTGGAGTIPRPEFLEPLRGCKVVMVFDCDDAGRTGADKWARVLTLDLECTLSRAG